MSPPDIGVEKYRELVINAPDAILVVCSGQVLFANPAAAALAGLPDPQSMFDRSVLEFVAPETRGQIIALIQQLHEERQPAFHVETEIVRVDGTRRNIEIMAQPTIYNGAKSSIVFIRDITKRKHAQAALRASEERYRQVVESMNEALIVYDPQGCIKFVNQQFCEMFHIEPEDVIGYPCDKVYAPETQILVQRGIERRRNGLHDRYEARLDGKNGKSVFAQISAAPLQHDGEFIGSLAIITDITDRQATQEKLRKSEQRYQELADSSPNYIVSFDAASRYTAANKAARDSLGLTEEEILGRTLDEAGIPADVVRAWQEQMDMTRATGKTQIRVTAVSFRGAAPRILKRISSPMYDESGAFAGVSVISIDITEQRLSEQKNQKLLRAIEEMDEVMFTTDPDGTITYVNPAFERMYGFTREEAIGKNPRIVKSNETPTEVYEHLWRELFAGRTARAEFANRRKDGQLVRVIASVSPVHAEDGRLVGYTAVQRDVTAERTAEAQHRQFEQQMAHTTKMQALGTLAGGIAHDFNNILSIVLTHATVAELSKGNVNRLQDAIGTIKRAVNRGAGLSRQILTFARSTEVQFATLDVNRAASEIGSMVREMFPRNIQIDLDLDSEAPAVRADADQLHQALLNLSLNARDAMSNGGTLRLSTRRVAPDAIRKAFPAAPPSDYVCVSVSDTGHGMTPEVIRRIFEPFFTTKEIGKGTGLGLAVVYGVIKAHHGWIDVTSTPGQGSSFHLYFPAVAAASTEERVSDYESTERGEEHVLLIEDENEIADAIAFQLMDRGYEVTTAYNADQAAKLLSDRGGHFNVIVTDLGMPGTSSRDLVKLLRATAPDIPVIPMTGYVDPELHNDIVAAGTETILEKPFSIDQLVRRIHQAISARGAAVS